MGTGLCYPIPGSFPISHPLEPPVPQGAGGPFLPCGALRWRRPLKDKARRAGAGLLSQADKGLLRFSNAVLALEIPQTPRARGVQGARRTVQRADALCAVSRQALARFCPWLRITVPGETTYCYAIVKSATKLLLFFRRYNTIFPRKRGKPTPPNAGLPSAKRKERYL